MSAFIVQLPSLSPTMEQGTIAEWKVKEGEFIESGQVIASITTDKSTVDYESLDEGYLKKIILKAGSAGVVGQIMAVMTEEEDDQWEDYLAKKFSEQEAKQAETQKEEREMQEVGEEVPNVKLQAQTSGTIVSTIAPVVLPPKQIAQPQGAFGNDKKIVASPVAKKVAKEKNINLATVEPKTNGTRIVLADVENLPDGYGMNQAQRSTGLVGYVNRAKNPITDIALTPMRQAISNRMVQASAGVPVFYLTVAVKMDALLDLRKQLNSMEDTRISINDFIIKATALALRKYPEVNSSFQGDKITQLNDVDISVAVSILDGLITPIVRSADTKGLKSISKEVKELVGKARKNTLEPEQYQGGSFTISNLGMFGVETFTAILNPPSICNNGSGWDDARTQTR